MTQKILIRRGLAAEWESADPILTEGEMGIELSEVAGVASRYKIGDGLSEWTDLPYAGGGEDAAKYPVVTSYDAFVLSLGGASGGSYDLNAHTLAYNASDATIEAALETEYGAGEVTVSGGVIVFSAAESPSGLTADFTDLTDATAPALTPVLHVTYDQPRIYGTAAAPHTGGIVHDLTGGRPGVVQKIYHEAATEPGMPAQWQSLGGAAYLTNELNLIFAEYSAADRVDYWIIPELGVALEPYAGVPDADGMVWSSTIAGVRGWILIPNPTVTAQAVTASTSATTINLTNGRFVTLTMGADTTLTISNPKASGTYDEFILQTVQGSTARAITYPANTRWPYGQKLDLSAGDADVDLWHWWTINGGTNWHVSLIGSDWSVPA